MYVRTYIHTYIIYTYIRTYIHIHTYNPLCVRSTFTVIQYTVQSTVYYESWPQQSFILQVELEVETLLDSILYFKQSVT